MFVNVDKEMATTIADIVRANSPVGEHVLVTTTSPAVSQAKYTTLSVHVKGWCPDWKWV